MTTVGYRENLSIKILSIALAIIFFWFGGLKFTDGAGSGLEGLVSNSPLLSWTYSIVDSNTFATLLGSLEVLIGVLFVVGLFNLKVRTVAGIAGMATFFVTVSFMLTTPGVVPEDASFPILSAMPGEFLLKDIVLFAASFAVFNNGRLHAGLVA